MTTTETQVDNLRINRLTKQQYDNITPNANELYLITDDIGVTDSDIVTALGYTPSQTIVITNPALTVTGGLLTWTIAQTIGTGVKVTLYNVSTGEQFMPDSITVTSTTAVVKILATTNASAGVYRAVIQG